MSSKEQDVLTLDIDKINALSPYAVTYDEDERAFVFVTANGQNCYVSFSPDEGALPEINRVYYLLVGTHPNQCFREDPAIRDAITAIVTVFFEDRNRVLAYFCDFQNQFENRHPTSYPMQTLRNRLFNFWYIRANRNGLYEKLNATIDRGGSPNHVAVIYCRDYPHKKTLNRNFSKLIDYLTSDTEKP